MDIELHREEIERMKYQHEGEVARLELHNKRAYIFAFIMFLALVVTNGAWLYYESQFEDSTTLTQTVSSDGAGNIAMNGIGDFNYGGEGNTDNKENTP